MSALTLMLIAAAACLTAGALLVLGPFIGFMLFGDEMPGWLETASGLGAVLVICSIGLVMSTGLCALIMAVA